MCLYTPWYLVEEEISVLWLPVLTSIPACILILWISPGPGEDDRNTGEAERNSAVPGLEPAREFDRKAGELERDIEGSFTTSFFRLKIYITIMKYISIFYFMDYKVKSQSK